MRYLILCAALLVGLAQAHEVHTRIEAAGAVVVTLVYANGEPFAYEKYTLTPTGRDTPTQVGNTDAEGRIVFVPGTTSQWRVQASSADGHGVNFEFATPLTADASVHPAHEATPRWLLAILGVSIIFGGFGIAQLLLRAPRS